MGSLDDHYVLQPANYTRPVEEMLEEPDIERIAFQIGLADTDERFEKIVQKSLIPILTDLSAHYENRKRILELLGDVTRRLKLCPKVSLPVNDLLHAYNDPENETFLTNFSHMYIRLGYPRLSLSDQVQNLPLLFSSLTDNKPVVQRDVLLHLTLPVIGHVPADLRNRLELELQELPVQRRYINEFYSLVLLLPYNFERLIRFDFSSILIPEGFNSYDYSRVAHERFSAIHDREELEKYKIAIVNFYSRGFFPPDESILPLLFADADIKHTVVSAANKEVRMLSVLVDWENEVLLSRIFDWYLGRRREFDPKGLSEKRQPLSANVRIKLGQFLLRSRLTLPGRLAPDLIEAAVLSLKCVTAGSNAREPVKPTPMPLQQQQQTLANNTPAAPAPSNYRPGQNVQRKLISHGLDLLTHLLDNTTSIPTDASVRALGALIDFVFDSTSDDLVPVRARGFELLSRFLAREPNYLLKDPSQLPRLFDVLSEDVAPDLKTAAAHCLRRLAFTFQEAQRQNYPTLRNQLSKLERLLFDNMEKSDPVGRLVAVHFAGIIYPQDHIPTRYLILQAFGDRDAKVRNEAQMALSIFLNPSIAQDIVYGRVKVPNFVDFVMAESTYIRKASELIVERIIPVVQFSRLCLLATKGTLSTSQEKDMVYETDDEVRCRINQNVGYLLSLSYSDGGNSGSSSADSSAGKSVDNGSNGSGSDVAPNRDSARRSVVTYLRLIRDVIVARCQSVHDSPEFLNFMEEVVVNNIHLLKDEAKEVLNQVNFLVLGTSRGAHCRHASASIFATFTMEMEQPTDALSFALSMLEKVPAPSTSPVIDEGEAHVVQGMVMGVAYLLKHLFDRYCVLPSSSPSATTTTTTASPTPSVNGTSGAKSKKAKKADSKHKQQLQSSIMGAIDKFLRVVDPYLLRAPKLVDKPLGTGNKEKASSDTSGPRFTSVPVAQSTVVALLQALSILGQAGCLAHLPTGATNALPTVGASPSSPLPAIHESKANLVARVAHYLTLSAAPASTAKRNADNGETQVPSSGHQSVWCATLHTLASFCFGEPMSGDREENMVVSTHPHLTFIIEAMAKLIELRDPALQLAVGAAMSDALLGAASPHRGLWYERAYPMRVAPWAAAAAVRSPAGRWLAARFASALQASGTKAAASNATTMGAALWALAMARQFTPTPMDLLPPGLFINLLADNDESIQCMAASILGLIYDRNDEAAQKSISDSLNKMIKENKRPSIAVFREVCSLAYQIGREEMSLPLVVLATTPQSSRSPQLNAVWLEGNSLSLPASVSGLPTTGSGASGAEPANALCSVVCAGLVRRLGRSLAPALPRLVPRVFIRRYDTARPRLRLAMQKIWLGLILYATSVTSNAAALAAAASKTVENVAASPTAAARWDSSTLSNVSINTLDTELIDANFNAILCEIKTQLGLTSTNKSGAGCPDGGSRDSNLRDACCLATVALTEHPSAYRQFSAHLPALLSGLLSIVDSEAAANDDSCFEGAGTGSPLDAVKPQSPASRAADAIQKLMIRALDDPACRDVATSLLPRLLPILINRVLQSHSTSSSPSSAVGEGPSLTLQLLVSAAARAASHACLRTALPQLVTTALRSMETLTPPQVVALMRPCASTNNLLASTNGVVAQAPSRESKMVDVLRLSVRLMDESALSQLETPLMNMIRAAGGSDGGADATSAAAVATAACIFLSHVALSSTSVTTSSSSAHQPTTTRYSGQGVAKKASEENGRGGGACVPLTRHSVKLLSVLLGALPTAGRKLEPSCRTSLQEEMAQAVAALLRFTPSRQSTSDPKRKYKNKFVAKVFTRVREWFFGSRSGGGGGAEGPNSTASWACVRVIHAVARSHPDILIAHSTLTLPLIFINAQSSPREAKASDAPCRHLLLSPGGSDGGDDKEAREDAERRHEMWRTAWLQVLSSISSLLLLHQHHYPQQSQTPPDTLPSALVLRERLAAALMASLREALVTSSSWLVRNQAALALLSVADTLYRLDPLDYLIADSAVFSEDEDDDASAEVVEDADEEGDSEEDGKAAAAASPGAQSGNRASVQMTHVLCEMVQVLAAAIKDTGAWSGKVYLLRCVHTVVATFLCRELDPATAVTSELWEALVRESRPGRCGQYQPASAAAAYEVEVLWALADLARIDDSRDASGMTAAAAGDKDCDRVARLLRLVLPNGAPPTPSPPAAGGKKSANGKKDFPLNSALSEALLERALMTLGDLWPSEPAQVHVDRFVDILMHLNYILSQGSWQVQRGALYTLQCLFEKMPCEKMAELVKTTKESGGDTAAKLGLRDLVARLKRASDTASLTEHVLQTVSVIVRHEALLPLVRKSLVEVLNTCAKTKALKERASALLQKI